MDGAGPDSTSRVHGAGLLLVLATAVVSGVSTFVNGYAVQGTSSDAFVTVRNLAVAGLIAPLALVGSRAAGRLRPADWGRLVAIGLVGGSIPFLLFFRGLALADASGTGLTASFLYRTLFLMASVLGVVVLGERLSPRWWAAAGLLLLGNLLLLDLTQPGWSVGTLYVLAATALWAVEYTVSKRTLRDLPSGTVALGRMGFGALFLLAYLAASGQAAALGTFSSGQWTWVAISAVLLAVFVGTWYAGLKRVDLGVATAVLVLGFPVTWLLAIVVRGAVPTELAELGALAVALGVAAALGTGAVRSIGALLRRTGLRPAA